MKILFLLLSFVLCLVSFNLQAQTPQYYNYNNVGTSSNTFPFGQTAGKAVNWLFLAGDFNQPTPIPPGQQITKVYFFTTAAGTRTFTNLHILLAQNNITTLTTGTFDPGPYDTCFAKDTSLTSTLNGWMCVTLNHPFPYDPTKSLVIFVGQCSNTGTGIYIRQNTLTNIRRVWSVGGCPFVPTGGDAATLNFGVDVIPVPPISLCEGFNTTTFPPTNWTLTGTATALWLYNAVSAFGVGTGSAKADFYNVATGTRQLNSLTITPTFANDTLIFADAYCTFTTEIDKLEVLTSTNGGTTYTQLAMLNGGVSGELVTAPPQTAVFTPTATQWKYQKLGLPVGTNKVQFNAITAYGNNLYIDSICVKLTVTGISHYEGIPKTYSLSQNYPNPFNPVTKINYALPKSGFVSLKIYDMLGREVVNIVNENKAAGNYSVDFNAGRLTSGVYFYRLESNGFVDTKKMMLVK